MARRRRQRLPDCPANGKASFQTQGRALAAIEKIIVGQANSAAADVTRHPRAVFCCPSCGWWHLTGWDQDREGVTVVLVVGVEIQVVKKSASSGKKRAPVRR